MLGDDTPLEEALSGYQLTLYAWIFRRRIRPVPPRLLRSRGHLAKPHRDAFQPAGGPKLLRAILREQPNCIPEI